MQRCTTPCLSNCGVLCPYSNWFINLVPPRGTVAQQVGFNIPLRSIFKPSYSRNSLNTKRCVPVATSLDDETNKNIVNHHNWGYCIYRIQNSDL